MDKEIIIGGVDVSGCVQLVEEPFYPCGLGGECKGWENCYYKQLKRLEFELKVTKADYEASEQENEDLKKYIERMDKPVVEVVDADVALENARLKEEFGIESLTDKTTGKTIYRSNLVNKYKSCLQEIKEVAEKYDNLTYPVSSIGLSQEILRKITKAEEE